MSRPSLVAPPTAAAAFTSPIGTIAATASDVGLRAVSFDMDLLGEVEQGPNLALDALARWLDAYFRRQFDALPAVPTEPVGTPSDHAVWQEIRKIGPGHSRTYTELAVTVGRPGSARAVGGAVGRNPLLLVVPCHRVTGGGLRLTGYAAGIERKAWLLRHEGLLLL